MRIKPSDFPHDPRFLDPGTPPFRDESGTYHVFGYEDVMQVLLNRESAFSRDPALWLGTGETAHHIALDFMWMVEPFAADGQPGRHDTLRAVAEPWFRVRAVRTMEPVIRSLAAELIEEVVAKGTGELNLASELAYPLSLRVICRLTGIELERESWLRVKLDEFAQAPSYDSIPPQWDVQAYLWRMIAKRIAAPADELLDVLIAAWREGRLTDVELLGYIFGFVTAGSDTTGTSLTNAFSLLAEFGELDYARSVLEDDEALRRIVEEVVRFCTPFPTKPMAVVKESRFGNLTVPVGSVLQVWYAAANRDEAVNGGVPQASPRQFDPRRWPNRHVGLGWGKHFCLGGDLSRLETRILLQEGLRRLPGLELDGEKPFTRYTGSVYGVTEAYFRFDQQAAENVAEQRTAART
jgi:cytochrome P450